MEKIKVNWKNRKNIFDKIYCLLETNCQIKQNCQNWTTDNIKTKYENHLSKDKAFLLLLGSKSLLLEVLLGVL